MSESKDSYDQWRGWANDVVRAYSKIDRVAIIGVEHKVVWGCSEGYIIEPGEPAALVAAFEKQNLEGTQQNGFNLAGKGYMTIQASELSIYGKRRKGKVGVAVVKTDRAILVAEYESEDPSEISGVKTAVQKLADQL